MMSMRWLVVLLLLASPAQAQIPGGDSIAINRTPVIGGTPGNCLYINGTTVGQQGCSSTAAGITIGTSVITGGTTTRVLFDNAGVLGEYAISGTGSVCMTTSCVMTTPVLGIASATSVAIGGCAIGGNALCATGAVDLSSTLTTGASVLVNASAGGVQITTVGMNRQSGALGFFTGGTGAVGNFGTTQLLINGAAVTIGSSGSYNFTNGAPTGTVDLSLFRDAANTFAQRNGTNAQRHKTFNTFTDASNGEWFDIDWITTANVATIGARANGTGTVRPVSIIGAGIEIGVSNLTLTSGALGLAKITASASAPGAAGAKFEVVCGTNAGTAKLVMAAGTSGTAVTVVDNVGAGVTGC